MAVVSREGGKLKPKLYGHRSFHFSVHVYTAETRLRGKWNLALMFRDIEKTAINEEILYSK